MRYWRHSSRIASKSAVVSARNMAMRVCRKFGIPLNSGVAARCRRVCRIPRRSSIRSTLMRSCSSKISIFSLTVNSFLLKNQGQPNVALPTMTASTPYRSKASSACCKDLMSPLPIIGIWICGLFFTSPISVQSASPCTSANEFVRELSRPEYRNPAVVQPVR